MKRFVINRHGRIVLPCNFFPGRDFSVFATLEQFDAMIKRDFEEKARQEIEIVSRIDTGAYRSRYELLRDVAMNLFWGSRYAMTMYDKRPTRWRDALATGRTFASRWASGSILAPLRRSSQ